MGSNDGRDGGDGTDQDVYLAISQVTIQPRTGKDVQITSSKDETVHDLSG